ncbi:MAG: hypothetical protein WC805_00740 [Patescibacteria group bacterium]|jgi:hypothetical protein
MKKGKDQSNQANSLPKRLLAPPGLIMTGSVLLLVLAEKYWFRGALAEDLPSGDTAAGFNVFADLIQEAAGPLVGVIAVAAVVAGGIIYALSGGEPGRVKMAKNVILSAIYGLILYILMKWLMQLLGTTVTDYFSDLTNIAWVMFGPKLG